MKVGNAKYMFLTFGDDFYFTFSVEVTLNHCKVNKLTSDSHEKVTTYADFYAFLAKMVAIVEILVNF